MKKVFILFVVLVILAFSPAGVFSASETPKPGAVAVNSYELFWPIVAGKVKGDSLYSLKTLKESVRERLIYSKYRRAEYNLTLSVKRVVEAEKLYLINKRSDLALETLSEAQNRRQRVYDLMVQASDGGRDVHDLKGLISASLDNQEKLLDQIKSSVPDDQKEGVQQSIDSIKNLRSKLQ